jgi:hypothetical protein
MKIILLSTLLYLFGVVVILFLKPSLMFDKNGNWKEFGFNRDNNHTWFPFWLYCILWAILSYAIVKFFFKVEPVSVNLKSKSKSGMKPGYYVLDKDTGEGNIPKYVYLGPDEPVSE